MQESPMLWLGCHSGSGNYRRARPRRAAWRIWWVEGKGSATMAQSEAKILGECSLDVRDMQEVANAPEGYVWDPLL
jgi:hypothetical protein